ncbi:D-alanyl-D-alanine carboxypeptidase [Rhizobium sp. CG5]|uniref:D-alanyl-D-alanine carboxypeptidase n=1 Tax=Rhizobium sp. CG5 TaxID=2726076 RepID=UPI00203463F4|nr:D-alanyl-D-alanine carboxypeptidase [Rhizobium sp. CG5]MCM2474864.1 D-alanyl-D-alanine carboxypeptidase [Rhizobium sp. CG5]
MMMLFAACFAMVQPAQAAPRYAGIVIDAKTGKVLYDESADELRYPASLTKMMTLYLVFEALESGRIRLDTKVPVSAHAAAEPPSKLGVRAGGSVTVEQGIQSLVTRSANDMATALGEFIGGSEQRFAQQMTAKARALGMTKTTYRNANGLPNTAQMTTARDQARLSIALRQHFPQYYGYFSTRSFTFGKQVIGNHNRLLGNVRGVDGIKTGYTRAAGFNLATSAEADGRSIVAVVLGGQSGAKRDATMRQLVATYMPKASRSGGSNNLIAKHGSTLPSNPGAAVEVAAAETVTTDAPFATDRFALPSNGPVPVTRYDDGTGEVAYAAPSPASAAAAALSVVANPAPKPAQQSVAMAPPAQVLKAPVAPSVAVDRTVTSSTAPQSGWIIQIGASPDQKMAMDLLRSAQDKGGKVLGSAKPFTVAYGDGAEQLYRARFAGFDNQKTAVNTCKALKKLGIGCWAAMQ